MAEEELPTDIDVWKVIRGLLKADLLAGQIPTEPREMRPKEVYKRFEDQDIIDYTDKKVKEKFARMLRSLRAKHKNGDLENEDDSRKPLLWMKSAAKQVLRGLFRDGTISTAIYDREGIEQIWHDYCKGLPAFKRMTFDDAFVRRYKALRDDHLKKVKRCEEDLKAYTAAKLNHPTPALNWRGEPQWHGSEAQRQLKELIALDEHVGKKPKELWILKNDFKVYSLKSFRDHIHQEKRLQKFNAYVEHLKNEKIAALQY
jgi:hypothetical protein